MADEWIGTVMETAPRFMKGAEDMTLRKRLTWAMFKKRGRITRGHTGRDLNWDFLFSEAPVTGYGDGGTLDFDRRDKFRQFALDVRGYYVSDLMTEKEKLMNDGDYAIVKRYDRIMPMLVADMTAKFGTELYLDGYASGNENRFVGFDSFTGTGTTVDADLIAQPSDNYGGKGTAVATLGGSWSADLAVPPNAAIATDWPDGNGTTEYDCTSPKLLNWSASANWGTASGDWEDNCERVIRQAQHWTTSTTSRGIDVFTCTPKMFTEYCNHFQADRRILVPHKEANDLGFPDTLNQDGVAVNSEFGVAANSGYGWNIDEVELCIWGSEIFRTKGPTYDQKTAAYLFNIFCFGNFKFSSPKYFAKTKNYA